MSPTLPGRLLLVATLALFVLGACDTTPERRGSRPSPDSSPPNASGSPATEPSTIPTEPAPDGSGAPGFLVWSPGGLSDEALRAVAGAKGVRRAPVITGGVLWMKSASAGRRPPEGYSIPLEVAYAQPNAFANVMPEGQTLPVLNDGEAVIAGTAHALRGEPTVPFTIRTDRTTLEVIGIVADETTAGFELVTAGTPPPDWGARYTVTSGEVSLEDLRRAVAPHVDGPFRIKSAEDAPFLRHADAVHPPMLLKERFGEFAARPLPDGRLDVHPAWAKKNIQEKEVPILGRITCHRLFVEQVADALAAARSQGMASLIDPGEYAGCYSARFILSDPSGRLSSHAWGAAIDINAPGNAYGAEPTMSRRLVRHMEEWGFFWGGRWMIPDGMHFEWARHLD